MKQLEVVLVLLLATGASAWSWGASQGSTPPARFSVVPKASKDVGQGQLSVLQSEAGKETFLDRLLGTNCYGKAVGELAADCRSMDQEQKSRLALRLVNCQLATQGDATHPCGVRQPLRACTDALPDRAYQLYVEFLSHADNMCLFIQNQNFEKYTEGMLNKLADGAAFAKGQLESLGQQVSEQHASLTEWAQEAAARAEEVLQLGREQREVQDELLETAKRHREESLSYFTSLNARTQEVLELQDQSLAKQGELQAGQEGMARMLSDGSNRLESLFGFIDDHAHKQLEMQRQHEEQQATLTSDLKSLAADTVGLRSAVDVVLRYEQRSDAALIKLLGRSYTLEDAAFYGAGVLGVVAAGAVPGGARARLPVLALLCSALVGERLVLQRLHMVLERDPSDELVVYLPVHLLPLPAALAPSEAVPLNVKWGLRKGLACLAALMVAYAAASYRSYERDSYAVLRRLEADTKASSAQHAQRLARIEQRLAAIQEWERQRLALLAAQQQVLPTPAALRSRAGGATAVTAAAGVAAAARLLPPALLMPPGDEGWFEGKGFGDTTEEEEQGTTGSLKEELGISLGRQHAQQQQQQQQRQQVEVAVAPAAARGRRGLASKAQPGAGEEAGPSGGTGTDRKRPKTPALPGSVRKRRGSEEAQEGAVLGEEEEEGGGRGRARRRPSASVELPAKETKRGRARAAEPVAEGGTSKRARR